MTMVMEQPKQAAKPKPNRALADPWCGVDYVSSEDLGLHDTPRGQRAPRYESSHRHEDECRCIDCRMYWWHVARAAWRDFEADHGWKLPPLPPYPTTEKERREYDRVHSERIRIGSARLRVAEFWYANFCKFTSYPPARMIDDIFGDVSAQDSVEAVDEPAGDTLAWAMNYAREGNVIAEDEGHLAGERDVWGEQRKIQMIRDAEHEDKS